MKNKEPRYNEWTVEKFVAEANKVHNHRYDYGQSVYQGYVNKINIICPKHGEFHQYVKSHIDGRGCKKCAFEIVSNKNTGWTQEQEKFLSENFQSLSMVKISKHLNKAPQTVWNKARKLNLTKVLKRFHHTIPNYVWANLTRGAKDRNLEVTITINDIWNLFIQQSKRCALTGWDVEFVRRKAATTASVDRIDSSKGYTLDNIQIVHKKVNKLKMDFSENDFFAMCKAIANNIKHKNIPKNISHWEIDIWNDTEFPVYSELILNK